jgi:hypothetical protein
MIETTVDFDVLHLYFHIYHIAMKRMTGISIIRDSAKENGSGSVIFVRRNLKAPLM